MTHDSLGKHVGTEVALAVVLALVIWGMAVSAEDAGPALLYVVPITLFVIWRVVVWSRRLRQHARGEERVRG